MGSFRKVKSSAKVLAFIGEISYFLSLKIEHKPLNPGHWLHFQLQVQ